MDILTRSTRIHVEEQGDGKMALVFLHYWGGSSRSWDGVVGELSNRYRTITTDHRGWGDSDAPEHGYTIADLANDAQDVIEALNLRRYVLVGHSMGGKVAQLLASRRPNGLEGVVLVAPSPPSPMVLSDEQRAAMAAAYDSRESISWVLDNVLTANLLTPADREQVIVDSLRGAPQAKAAWPNAAMLEDITGDVVSINVPVMVIAGELDQVDRVETLQKELLPRIAAARLHVLPGTGHLSPLEAPFALATGIRAFVGELESQSNTSTRNTPEQVPAAFDAAFNNGDIDSLLGLFSDNATMRMADGETVVSGLEELRRQFSGLLKSGPRIRNQVVFSLVSDDIALVLLDWTVTVTLPDGDHASSRGTATQVMTRGDDGGWKLRISNPLGTARAAEVASV
ncbi:alpha/beta fold hydrolase [Paraburkholderia haematera]|uniref:2-succinyl-6-hydroxy-2, 4-cyclohexadiene-1-carboxylate synthase n=1 Tax=Paraburkholderia haematera TaxID=2793077 RepID=A0ABM8SPZ7_9BURK|nr:alpha/beta fold hydrolase [Paraburkholderia haematera]CAE6824181.1 2-succinyl-6-hydroxy-2, 4-cyclohexadiene-1-carboxylate synthase [Paraburkholderia haematera]